MFLSDFIVPMKETLTSEGPPADDRPDCCHCGVDYDAIMDKHSRFEDDIGNHLDRLYEKIYDIQIQLNAVYEHMGRNLPPRALKYK